MWCLRFWRLLGPELVTAVPASEFHTRVLIVTRSFRPALSATDSAAALLASQFPIRMSSPRISSNTAPSAKLGSGPPVRRPRRISRSRSCGRNALASGGPAGTPAGACVCETFDACASVCAQLAPPPAPAPAPTANLAAIASGVGTALAAPTPGLGTSSAGATTRFGAVENDKSGAGSEGAASASPPSRVGAAAATPSVGVAAAGLACGAGSMLNNDRLPPLAPPPTREAPPPLRSTTTPAPEPVPVPALRDRFAAGAPASGTCVSRWAAVGRADAGAGRSPNLTRLTLRVLGSGLSPFPSVVPAFGGGRDARKLRFGLVAAAVLLPGPVPALPRGRPALSPPSLCTLRGSSSESEPESLPYAASADNAIVAAGKSAAADASTEVVPTALNTTSLRLIATRQ